MLYKQIIIFICSVILITGCSQPGGSTSGPEIKIIATASVSGLKAPVTGNIPVSLGALTTGAITYSVESIDWTPVINGFFAAEVSYTVAITLRAAVGYKFNDSTPSTGGIGTVTSNTVIGDGEENALTFVVSFSQTAAPAGPEIKVITAASVSGLKAPVTGDTPITVNALTTGAITYSVESINWTPVINGFFAAEGFYTVAITLRATGGYKFNDSTPSTGGIGTVTSKTVVGDGEENALTFVVSFPQTTVTSFSGLSGNAIINGDGLVVNPTTMLTLTFDRDITGLSADNIVITPNGTGAIKGLLSKKGTGLYDLAVSGIHTSGEITVTVNVPGYGITPASETVEVFYFLPAAFTALTANGSVIETTSKLTLTFDQDIIGLTANDIILDNQETGTVKGDLSRIGAGLYELTVSGITTTGTISLGVSRTGYTIAPDTQGVTLRRAYAAAISINLESDWDLISQYQTIKKSTSALFSVTGTYAEYQWYLDGTPVGTDTSYTFNGSDTQAGDVYELAVKVTDTAGDKRSGRCRITITN